MLWDVLFLFKIFISVFCKSLHSYDLVAFPHSNHQALMCSYSTCIWNRKVMGRLAHLLREIVCGKIVFSDRVGYSFGIKWQLHCHYTWLKGYTWLIVVMELTGVRYRSALGVTIQIGFSVGYMMQPAMAVFLRDEFHYQLAALAPNLLFPVLIMYVPALYTLYRPQVRRSKFLQPTRRSGGPRCVINYEISSNTGQAVAKMHRILTFPDGVHPIRHLSFFFKLCSCTFYASSHCCRKFIA